MRITTSLAIVALAALLQSAIMPSFSLFGAHPNLVVVILAAWIAVRGKEDALVMVPAGGLALGLLDSYPLGLALLALAPMIVLAEGHDLRIIDAGLPTAIVIVMVATVCYESAFLITLAVGGEPLGWLAAVADVLVPAVAANVLLLLPAHWVVRLASVDLRRRPAF